MIEVMRLLEERLTPLEFAMLSEITQGFGGPPFLYSAKRKEFFPSDEWFTLTGDSESTNGSEVDPDTIMELAWKCVEVLGENPSGVDLRGMLEEEPIPVRHVLAFPVRTEDLASKVVKALTEAGYTGVSVKRVGDGWELGVPFTASTDWEFETGRSSLKSTIHMIIRCCEGKGTLAARI